MEKVIGNRESVAGAILKENIKEYELPKDEVELTQETYGKVKTTYMGDYQEIVLDLEALSSLKDMDRIEPS